MTENIGTKAMDKLKINLNQNIWWLIISYSTVGFSQRYGFHELWWLAFVMSCFCSLSVLICLAFYTINYCRHKYGNANSEAKIVSKS
jgi:hypothetical protein